MLSYQAKATNKRSNFSDDEKKAYKKYIDGEATETQKFKQGKFVAYDGAFAMAASGALMAFTALF